MTAVYGFDIYQKHIEVYCRIIPNRTSVKTLALFDFDGTITTHDTMLDLACFSAGKFRYILTMIVISPVLLLMKLKLISNSFTKELFMSVFFGGMNEQAFVQLCNDYSKKRLPELIRPRALAQIQSHQENGDDVYVVSASATHWLQPWCNQQQLSLICSQLEIVDQKLTGKLDGPNCNGEEKVRRIQQAINLSLYDKIIAYGDSSGDKEMFAISHEHYFKPFRNE